VRTSTLLTPILCLALLGGCGDDDDSGASGAERAEAAEARATTAPPRIERLAGGVGWQAEEPFVAVRPDNEMRDAQYEVRDHPEAVLTVAHFPPSEGGGGDVQANLDRWVGQLRNASEPVIERREVHDLPVTTVDVRGTFVGRRGMGGPTPPQPGYRLLGAIVEGPQGLVFFKLLGPAEAVHLAADAFARLVETIHPA
jgi:hypothetical protein